MLLLVPRLNALEVRKLQHQLLEVGCLCDKAKKDANSTTQNSYYSKGIVSQIPLLVGALQVALVRWSAIQIIYVLNGIAIY